MIKFLRNRYNKVFRKSNDTFTNFGNYVFDANTRYDLQTFHIIKQILSKNSSAIDVGANRGDILTKIIQAAPNGQHFAFEPIPDLYENLKNRFRGKAIVYPYALAEKDGIFPFNYVTSNPAYSGLLRRKYDRMESDMTIEVEVKKMDDIIPKDVPVNLIKIDVEGAESGVIRGAKGILKKWKPVIIYEQGLGASDIYGTDPGEFYDYLSALGYRISLMEYYLLKKEPLSRAEYCHQFNKAYNYYFIAY
jgi:FkbM family methyltransferase